MWEAAWLVEQLQNQECSKQGWSLDMKMCKHLGWSQETTPKTHPSPQLQVHCHEGEPRGLMELLGGCWSVVNGGALVRRETGHGGGGDRPSGILVMAAVNEGGLV